MKRSRIPGMTADAGRYNRHPIPQDFGRSYLGAYLTVLAYVGDDRRDLCWGSMIYACAGDWRTPGSGCSHEERYYLGLGVEGPPEFRHHKVFIPSPFMAGGCVACGGAMQHDRWEEDEEWTEAEWRPAPEGARYFRVPDEATAREFATEGYGGGELVDPHPAPRRAA